MSTILAGFLRGAGAAGAAAEQSKLESQLAEERIQKQHEMSKARELSLMQLKQQFNADQTAADSEALTTRWKSALTIPAVREAVESRGLNPDDPIHVQHAIDSLDLDELTDTVLPEFLGKDAAAQSFAEDTAFDEMGGNDLLRDVSALNIQSNTQATASANREVAAIEGETAATKSLAQTQTEIDNGLYGIMLARMEDEATARGRGEESGGIEARRDASLRALDGSLEFADDFTKASVGEDGSPLLSGISSRGHADAQGLPFLHLGDESSLGRSIVDMTTGPVNFVERLLYNTAPTNFVAEAWMGSNGDSTEAMKVQQAFAKEARDMFIANNRSQKDIEAAEKLANFGGIMTGDDGAMSELRGVMRAAESIYNSESRRLQRGVLSGTAEDEAWDKLTRAEQVLRQGSGFIAQDLFTNTKIEFKASGGTIKVPVGNASLSMLLEALRNRDLDDQQKTAVQLRARQLIMLKNYMESR